MKINGESSIHLLHIYTDNIFWTLRVVAYSVLNEVCIYQYLGVSIMCIYLIEENNSNIFPDILWATI